MRIVKKLTNKEFQDLPIGKSILLAGVVRSFEEGEGAFGPYVKFMGAFGTEMTVVKDGVETIEKIRSGIMYVPEVMANMLVTMVEEGLKHSGDAYNGTEFAFRLLKQADSDERNARKYKWAVETVQEPEPSLDPVSRIMLAHGANNIIEVATEPETVNPEPETINPTPKKEKHK